MGFLLFSNEIHLGTQTFSIGHALLWLWASDHYILSFYSRIIIIIILQYNRFTYLWVKPRDRLQSPYQNGEHKNETYTQCSGPRKLHFVLSFIIFLLFAPRKKDQPNLNYKVLYALVHKHSDPCGTFIKTHILKLINEVLNMYNVFDVLAITFSVF